MINGCKSDGERIGSIIRVDFPGNIHHPHDHFNDLLLCRPAVSRHLLLDLQRRHGNDRHILPVACKRMTPLACATLMPVVIFVLK